MAKAVTSSCGSYSGKNKTAALQKYADFSRSRHVSGRQFCHQCCRVMKSQSLGISRRKAQMECRPSGSEGRNRSCNEAMITEDCLSTDGLSASHPTAAKSPTDSCTTALKHSNDLQASYSWSEAETRKVGDKSSGNWFYECKVASSSLQSSSNNNEQGKDVLSALMRHSSQISFENAMSVEDTCQASTLVENSTQEPVEHVDPGDCHLKLDEPCMERVFSHVVPAEHLMQPVEGSFQTPDRNLYSSILGQRLEEFTVEERSPVQSSWAPGIPRQPITNDAEPETSCQDPMTTLDGMEEPGSELVHQSVGWLANSSKPVKASDVDNGSSVVDDGDVEQCGEDVGDESLQHDGNGEMEQEDDANAMICDGQEQCFERSEQVSSMQVEADDVAGKANHIASEANGTAVAVSSNTEDASDIVAETVDTTAECSNMMAECSDLTAGLSHVMTESRDRTLAPDEWYTTVIERDGTPSGDEGGPNSLVGSNVRSQHTQPELGIQHLGRQINLPEITEPSLCFNDSSFMATFSDSDDEDESDLPAVLMTRSSQSESVPEHDQQAANTTQENQNKEANPVQVLPSGDGERKMADLRMMLDFMLTEKICKLEDNRKLAAQVDELNEDLRKGGITKFSLEDLTEVEETELLPEHKAKLKQFEIQNCQISGEAPGLHLFDCTKVHHLFSFPTTLTLSVCGFVPGRSSLDKMLATADPDCISELLNSQMIQMCFESLSSPDVFMDWLFFLLSDVTGELLSSSSLKTLLDLLQREHGKSSHWIPTPLTLARVFVNYGASLSMLLPVDDLVDFTDSDLSLTNNKENSQPDNNPVTGQMLPPTGQWCYFDGLRRVLRVLAEAIHKRRHLYSVKDLLAITVMLFRVSIDQNLNNNCLMHDLKLCISAILNAIPHEKWYSYISQLCQFAPQLASHHHNLLQLVEVLPPSERGITLQHHLAYVFLHYLSFGSCDQDFMDLKIRDLLPIVRSFQVGEGTDFYRLYSLCVLLDRCISKKTLPVSEKDHLKVLCDMLKCLMGSVRECITDLDRSVVKELLTQLISILSIKLESMGFRQRTMFEYCLPPSEERPSLAVDQTQDDQSEDDSILGSQSEVSRSCE